MFNKILFSVTQLSDGISVCFRSIPTFNFCFIIAKTYALALKKKTFYRKFHSLKITFFAQVLNINKQQECNLAVANKNENMIHIILNKIRVVPYAKLHNNKMCDHCIIKVLNVLL